MKKMKKLLCIACAAIALSSISVALNNLSTATASANETPVLTNVFTMDEGASVRKVSPGGIRFTTLVSNDIKSDDKTFGTLIIPTEKLGEATLNFEAAETLSVLDIPATTWKVQGNDTTLWEYTGVLVGANNADLNEALWDKELTAVGYYYTGDDKSTAVYTTEQIAPQKRSLAQTASLALQAGETGATLTKIVDKIVEKNKDSLDLSLAFSANDTVAYTADSYAPNDSFTLYLQGNEGLAAKWSSSDDTVATVDKNGKVSVLANGEATITASIGSHLVAFTLTADDRLPVCGQPYTLEVVKDSVNYYAQSYRSGSELPVTTTLGTANPFTFEKASAGKYYLYDINAEAYIVYTASSGTNISSTKNVNLDTAGHTWTLNVENARIYSTKDTSRYLGYSTTIKAYSISNINTYPPAWFGFYDAEAAGNETAVSNAREALTLDTETVTEEKTIALTTAIENVSIAWEVTEGSEIATIANGNLTITLPEENATVIVKATLTCGAATATKNFEIAVQGTESGDTPAEPTIVASTLTFDDTSKRTEFSSSKQVWKENGITFTNNKASSTSSVADYAAPVRLYKSSEVIIECVGITKIEFACSSTDYATALKNSIKNATVSVSGTMVTAELDALADSFTFTLTGGQVRLSSLTVHAIDLSDADKVANEKAALADVTQTISFVADVDTQKSITLPTTSNNVTCAWNVITEVTSANVSISGNVLTIANVTESFSFDIKATLTLNDVSVDTDAYTITVEFIVPTDEDKVAAEKAALSFKDQKLDFTVGDTQAQTIPLPVTPSKYTDVSIAWDVVGDVTGVEVVINGATMSVTLTDATESFSFKVKATLSLNDASAESNEYTITVNVTAQNAPAEPVTESVTFSNVYSADTAFSSYALGDVITLAAAKNSGGTAPKYYKNGTALRLYGKNTFTITCEDGYKITSIIITSGSSNGITTSNLQPSNATMSINGKEVTVTPTNGTAAIVLTNPNSSGHCRIAAVKVTYEKV